MDRKGLLLALPLLAAVALGWRALSGSPVAPASPPALAPVEEPQPPSIPPATGGERTAVLAEPGEAAPAASPPALPSAPAPAPAGSPLARELDRIAASFLTEAPAVGALLDLVELTAARAVVPPESVTIQRTSTGDLLSARGSLAIGDVRGSFRIDQDSFGIEFAAGTDDPRWSRRVLHITFQADGEGPRACHAIVQFEPASGGALLGEPLPEREALIGWSVGTSLEGGTVARPLTLHAVEGAWTVGDSEDVAPQELPWVSGMHGFEAWLRLLEPWLASDGAPR